MGQINKVRILNREKAKYVEEFRKTEMSVGEGAAALGISENRLREYIAQYDQGLYQGRMHLRSIEPGQGKVAKKKKAKFARGPYKKKPVVEAQVKDKSEPKPIRNDKFLALENEYLKAKINLLEARGI